MNRAAKITTGAAVLVVGGLVALAVPTVSAAYTEVSSWAIFQSAEAPTVEPTSEADDALGEKMIDELGDGYVYVGNGTAIPKNTPAGCENPAWLHVGAMRASLSGELVDRGARELAAGTVGLDDDGRIKTYTVAPGDALYAIGDRFCIANPLALDGLNHTHMIAPGEVLLLAPDSSIPWVDYYAPVDAPGGFEQIPYQLALQAMSRAAHAGDVDAMRAIFADGLADMFPRQADADMIAQALDAGDLEVLRQMFA
ncbi:hypothetical protein ACFT30_04860 [Microbacterium ureisolvens]|uniref:hypothetical protein n=1 Tax=Microbacterium ureisolvens TaxID=2781186 RepID=UPI00363A6AC7